MTEHQMCILEEEQGECFKMLTKYFYCFFKRNARSIIILNYNSLSTALKFSFLQNNKQKHFQMEFAYFVVVCPFHASLRSKKLLTEVIHLLGHLGEHLKWLSMFHHFQNEGYLCRQKLQFQILVLNPLKQNQIQQDSIPTTGILTGRRKSIMNIPAMALYLDII